jgi:hypothetical protein
MWIQRTGQIEKFKFIKICPDGLFIFIFKQRAQTAAAAKFSPSEYRGWLRVGYVTRTVLGGGMMMRCGKSSGSALEGSYGITMEDEGQHN